MCVPFQICSNEQWHHLKALPRFRRGGGPHPQADVGQGRHVRRSHGGAASLLERAVVLVLGAGGRVRTNSEGAGQWLGVRTVSGYFEGSQVRFVPSYRGLDESDGGGQGVGSEDTSAFNGSVTQWYTVMESTPGGAGVRPRLRGLLPSSKVGEAMLFKK